MLHSIIVSLTLVLGIPFRRGYLLHGVPGRCVLISSSLSSLFSLGLHDASGKTSLIHSLAGELGLDIYVVSLSSKGSGNHNETPKNARCG